jgi:hypothetical protein
MAQSIGHLVAGKKLLTKLEPMNMLLIKNNRHFFNVGLQGPDILFCGLAKDEHGYIGAVGEKMHKDNVNNSLLCMQDYALHSRDNKFSLFSYLAGYVSHYHLDKNIHPYVGRKVREGRNHKLVEADIDGAIYRHYTGESVGRFSIKDVYRKDINFFMPIACMYQHIINEIFHRTFRSEDILKATRNLFIVNKLESIIKRDNEKDIGEIAQIFDKTISESASEINAMLNSLQERKTFAINDTLSFENGL